jgi:Zn-dependent protease
MTRKLTMRTAHMLVAAAGPTMNVLLAAVVGVLTWGLVHTGVVSSAAEIYPALLNAIYLNCILAFFNLIPAPPLDGGAVVEGLLPRSALPAWHAYSKYSFFVLLAFFFIARLQLLFIVPARYLFVGIAGLLGLPPPGFV